MSKIKRNAIRCIECRDEIESTHRHDFRSCRCGAVFVDGGKSYLRRGHLHRATAPGVLGWDELSEYEPDA